MIIFRGTLSVLWSPTPLSSSHNSLISPVIYISTACTIKTIYAQTCGMLFRRSPSGHSKLIHVNPKCPMNLGHRESASKAHQSPIRTCHVCPSPTQLHSYCKKGDRRQPRRPHTLSSNNKCREWNHHGFFTTLPIIMGSSKGGPCIRLITQPFTTINAEKLRTHSNKNTLTRITASGP